MKPKLRPIEAHPIHHAGQPMILLRDPLELSESSVAVPRPLAPLLALMDGTRDEAELEAALRVRAGVRLAPGLLGRLLADLDRACLLDNERCRDAQAAALHTFRQAPFRPMTLDGATEAPGPEAVGKLLDGYVQALPEPGAAEPGSQPAASDGDGSAGAEATGPERGHAVRGLISPHIDYQRGGPVYAQAWRAASAAAEAAELVIFFGTDHQGDLGSVTLTRQSYATPWGVLPTDAAVVQELAEALGEEAAFAEELHHRREHSIELAAIWLHYIRGGRPVPIVPILCGSFAGFVSGPSDPAGCAPFAVTVEVLRRAMADRRTLVVAAADLAHMGPAFGDRHGLDFIGRAQLRQADERLLETVYAGDAAAFFALLKAEGDRRNVCGLPPIYLTLRLLDGARGTPAGYDVCPADAQGMSFVSIAGAVWY